MSSLCLGQHLNDSNDANLRWVSGFIDWVKEDEWHIDRLTGERRMLVSDVLHSCAHKHVAEAAVASIGGEFAIAVRRHADVTGQSVGDFTAARVREFSRWASERDWRQVTAEMRGEDLALLSGLRVVMTRMMMSDGGATSMLVEVQITSQAAGLQNQARLVSLAARIAGLLTNIQPLFTDHPRLQCRQSGELHLRQKSVRVIVPNDCRNHD